MFAHTLAHFVHELFLMVAAQFTQKRAVLDTVQAVVEANIGHFLTCAIVGDVVENKGLHWFKSPTGNVGGEGGGIAAQETCQCPRLLLDKVAHANLLSLVRGGAG